MGQCLVSVSCMNLQKPSAETGERSETKSVPGSVGGAVGKFAAERLLGHAIGKAEEDCIRNGCEGQGGLCYRPCPDGYKGSTGSQGLCVQIGGEETGAAPIPNYEGGARARCWKGVPMHNIDFQYHYCLENGCDHQSGLCYRKCPEGWVVSATEPTSCTKPCPPYHNDTGGTCYKGTIPLNSIIKLPRSEWFQNRGVGAGKCANGVPFN